VLIFAGHLKTENQKEIQEKESLLEFAALYPKRFAPGKVLAL
jgi:hypothetical protein